VTFLVHARNGLSAWLARSIPKQKVYLDGPYGLDLQLGRYKTVILVGDGIGIAGILPHAQYLAERKRNDFRIKEKIKKKQEVLKVEQDHFFRAKTKADEADCAASAERMKKIREELRELKEKNLHRDFTQKVDLYWVLDENYQYQWVNDRLKKLQDIDSTHVGL
jgi:ferredoxin-NADP reductase